MSLPEAVRVFMFEDGYHAEMRRRTRRYAIVIGFICLILFAGCSSFGQDGLNTEQPTQASTETNQPTQTPVNTREVSETVAESETASPAVNPWGKQTVTIRLERGGDIENRTRHRVALQDAIEWYNDARLAKYEIQFAYTTGASADVTVVPTNTIGRCGDETTDDSFLWCVPQYEPGSNAPASDTLEITTRYEQPTTETVYREALTYLTGTDQPRKLEEIERPESLALRDPWPARDTVIINVTDPPDDDSAQRVRRALEYWSGGEGAQYRNYTQEFVLRPNADRAAVTINYTRNVGRCGFIYTSDIGGCAPVYSGDKLARDHSEIRISTAYIGESRERILVHEFGHLYGRLHGQPPYPEMNATADLIKRATPNATTRDQPWRFDLLRVYLDREAIQDRDIETAERELLDSFASMTDDVAAIPDGVRFERVDERDQADIIITVDEIDGDAASTSSLFGEDSDDDGALEQYTQLNITIAAETPAEDYGYHMAYWTIGSFVGSGEMPDHIDAEDDNRENWEENRGSG
jgi:hypothetical protein